MINNLLDKQQFSDHCIKKENDKKEMKTPCQFIFSYQARITSERLRQSGHVCYGKNQKDNKNQFWIETSMKILCCLGGAKYYRSPGAEQ